MVQFPIRVLLLSYSLTIRSMIRAGRERERWLVTAVQGIVTHLNTSFQKANPLTGRDGSAVVPPAPIQVDDFDMGTARFEDDISEAESEPGEDD